MEPAAVEAHSRGRRGNTGVAGVSYLHVRRTPEGRVLHLQGFSPSNKARFDPVPRTAATSKSANLSKQAPLSQNPTSFYLINSRSLRLVVIATGLSLRVVDALERKGETWSEVGKIGR